LRLEGDYQDFTDTKYQ